MPIFEYRCPECGEEIEKLQRQPFAEIPCPACGKAAKRAVSPFSSAAPGAGGCAAPGGKFS